MEVFFEHILNKTKTKVATVSLIKSKTNKKTEKVNKDDLVKEKKNADNKEKTSEKFNLDSEYFKNIEAKLLSNPKYKFLCIVISIYFTMLFLSGIVFIIIFLIFKFLNKKIINLKKTKISYYLRFSFIDLVKFVIVYMSCGALLKFSVFGIFLFCSYFFAYKYCDLLGINIVLNAFFMNILPILFLFNYMKKEYGQDIKYLGINFKDKFKKIFFGISAYITFFPILIVMISISFIIVSFFKLEVQPHPIVPVILEQKSGLVIGFIILFASIIGPVTEEIIFRGIIYNVFRKRVGIVLASILSSFFFAVLHMDFAVIGVVFAMGVLLAYLYEETGSLMPAIVVHVLHNSIMMGIVLMLKKILV